ncbi:MAG TPA: hypothetical protein VJ652_16415 [Noviherbaspirillum sp.]|nr:hypothetical protein [Noviherbaspirillum sp.]
MIGHNQQKRDRMAVMRSVLTREQTGYRRDVAPMSPELRRRLADRWERELARSLAGEDAA